MSGLQTYTGFAASELTRRITLTSYDFVQTDSGGVNKILAETFDTWAKVEQKGGGMGFNQAQMMADASYQVTIRYRAKVTTNWYIVYEWQVFKIDKIVFDNPGYKRFMIIDCSVSIQQTSWS